MSRKTLGIVADHDGERIETDFQTFGFLPLAPIASYYRRSDDQRYAIPFHPQSVLKGLLANHGAILSVVLIGLGAINYGDPSGELCLMSGFVCALLSAFARFRVGRPTPRDTRIRVLHQEVTGVSAVPSMLPLELVETLRDALDRKWQREHEEDWREVSPDTLDARSLKLAAVLASFEACLTGEATQRRRSAKLYAEVEALGDEALESLSPEEAAEVLRQVPDSDEVATPRILEDSARTKRRKRKLAKKSRGIKIRCERCDHVTKVPETCAGKTGLCPSCERGVRVPSLESMRLNAA